MRITILEAQAEGYTVDTYTYPHFGYKGPRFAPTAQVLVYTESEGQMLETLKQVLNRATMSTAMRDEVKLTLEVVRKAY